MGKKEEVNPFEGCELMLDRIIVEGIKREDEVRETGFTVPAAAREAAINLPKYGIVMACGPGDMNKGEMKVKVGDKICYAFYSGVPISVRDRHFLIMREFDVIFILKK